MWIDEKLAFPVDRPVDGMCRTLDSHVESLGKTCAQLTLFGASAQIVAP